MKDSRAGASAEATLDTILGGTISLFQPRRGYRFSIDSLLLAKFATVKAHARILDLGSGCGVIALMLASLARVREVVALEVQPTLVKLIERNARLNDLRNLRAVCSDLRTRKIAGLEPASFDLVVANPPYRAIGSGCEAPERGRRVARSETAATLDDFVFAARRYARHGGRVAMVFTASRAVEIIATLRRHRLEPKRVRFVHPLRDSPAVSVLVESRVGGGVELIVDPPLFIHQSPGVYTAEARELLNC